jgi:putative membrane protein
MADLSGIDLPDDQAGVVLKSTANERTYLAWTRTALSWGAVGVIMVRYHLEDVIDWPGVIAGMAMALCGLATFLVSIMRYRQRDKALRAGSTQMPPAAPMLRGISSLVVITTVVVIGAELARVFE